MHAFVPQLTCSRVDHHPIPTHQPHLRAPLLRAATPPWIALAQDMLHVRLTAVVEVFAWSLWSSALLQRPWSCHRYRICGRACIVVVAIVAAVREALSTTNTPRFPAEGAAGLALNSQAWLREPQLQSLRHCRAEAQLRWCADPRCPQ
jgi:hypothetical protein